MAHFLTIQSTPLAWAVVLCSGVLEVFFALAMKLSDGYSRPVPTLLSLLTGLGSVWLMSLTLKVLPIGTAYAVWAGIGAAGTALVGMVFFAEPTSGGRLLCLGLVVLGIIGLQMQSA